MIEKSQEEKSQARTVVSEGQQVRSFSFLYVVLSYLITKELAIDICNTQQLLSFMQNEQGTLLLFSFLTQSFPL